MASNINNAYFHIISFLCFHLFFFFFFISQAQALVPSSETFTYVNQGNFADYTVEYGGNYRVLSLIREPFTLCFYNTTFNAYTLGLRMGTARSENRMVWVWEANRGKPVRENATFSLRPDGNLVLAEADGQVVLQTNTANKGVVGIELLQNGNIVLLDSKRRFVWQSFDSPTDTLLVGQSLLAGGVSKLVSRASTENNSDGSYSFVMEPARLALYYTSPNSPRPILYWAEYQGIQKTTTLTNLTLISDPYYIYSRVFPIYALYFLFNTTDPNPSPTPPISLGTIARHNSTLTYLRLGMDGNLRFFIFTPEVYNYAWDPVHAMLNRDTDNNECQLPERCGNFGLCKNSQCVARPTPNGLSGWGEDCEAKKVTYCKASEFHYYKLEGVDHYMIKYTTGDVTKESKCESKCTSDCKCLGYFFHTDQSWCWIAYDLKTLTKVGNSTNLAYIKTPNN